MSGRWTTGIVATMAMGLVGSFFRSHGQNSRLYSEWAGDCTINSILKTYLGLTIVREQFDKLCLMFIGLAATLLAIGMYWKYRQEPNKVLAAQLERNPTEIIELAPEIDEQDWLIKFNAMRQRTESAWEFYKYLLQAGNIALKSVLTKPRKDLIKFRFVDGLRNKEHRLKWTPMPDAPIEVILKDVQSGLRTGT
jgi:hypothetical protein